MLKKLSALLILLLLSACGGGGGASPAAVTPPTTTGNKWTFMVYMDADNDLDAVSPYDLQEMQAIGSTPNVTVLVQYDTRTTTTKRYKVMQGGLTQLADLGEQDMASPDTLRDFISFAATAAPADHYALVLWDHGYGWKSTAQSKHSRSILVDWTNNGKSALPTPNNLVAQGIKAAENAAGITIDVLGVDACIMATMEAAYEFRNVAGILVASQDLVQQYGWDYRDLLARLTASPTMTPQELASNMVASYRQYAESASYGYGDQTISAIQLGQGIEALAQRINTLAQTLRAKMDDPGTRPTILSSITAARQQVQQFDDMTSPGTYVDLYDFDRLLEGDQTPLQQQLAGLLISEYHGSKRANAHGLSIVFFDLPRAQTFSVYDPNYRNYEPTTGAGDQGAFINSFAWDEMMHAYLSYQYPNLAN